MRLETINNSLHKKLNLSSRIRLLTNYGSYSGIIM